MDVKQIKLKIEEENIETISKYLLINSILYNIPLTKMESIIISSLCVGYKLGVWSTFNKINSIYGYPITSQKTTLSRLLTNKILSKNKDKEYFIEEDKFKVDLNTPILLSLLFTSKNEN